MVSPTLQFLLITATGWVTRHQLAVVEYLVEENRTLREQLGERRLKLTDAQRGRLAIKGKAIGRKRLGVHRDPGHRPALVSRAGGPATTTGARAGGPGDHGLAERSSISS
jgi:hypothetical protein